MLYHASWAGIAVPLDLEDGAFRDRVEQFLGIELRPAGDGEPAATSVRRTAGGWALETPFGPQAQTRDDDVAYILFECLAHAFWMRSQRPVVHAGAFMVEDGAVLYLAGLRQGKSRLTFAAWRHDYPILGDDKMVLHLGEHGVQAMPKCLKLRLDDDHVPAGWRPLVPAEHAFVGHVLDDRRWILSRRMPGVVSCDAVVPLHAVVALRRIDAGPTTIDEVPATEVLEDALPAATIGASSPLDVLRFLKPHAPGGRMRRLNVAPDEVDEGLALLAAL